ncbi:MAG: pyrroline-5-carboxylate reductase [Clostridiales bacterium]|jgi:pyrroline-5-carboxylate reductase|nr:pyrroline-5-carboxylate reductase [Clostridiales bacterium]
MENSTFAFIGAGNMGGAIIKALCKKCSPSDVFIYDRDVAKAKALSESTGCVICESADEAIKKAKYIILGVKPNILAPVLESAFDSIKASYEAGNAQVIVSIAAGITIDSIKKVLSKGNVDLPVIRLMPNTPVTVGKGLILIDFSKDTREEDVDSFMASLSEAGSVQRFPENLMDCATPVFSSSPAFVYMFIEALSDGGVMSGLPRDIAINLAAQAVLGSAAMVLETGQHPGALKDAVCSPAGSTIVGVSQLERGAFRSSVSDAVYETYKKVVELAK